MTQREYKEKLIRINELEDMLSMYTYTDSPIYNSEWKKLYKLRKEIKELSIKK